MISGLSIGSELKRFGRGRLPRVAIVVLVLMPLLYSALYLAAFWDPFGRTSQLPVALVNDDTGTQVDGEPLRAGDQVVDELLQNDQLDWRLVDAAEAEAGLSDHEYNFVVRLTPEFSESVASPTGDDPRQAAITVTYDQSGNYLSSLIGRSATAELHNAVGSAISAQAVDKVLVGVQDAGAGLREAADGAAQLDDGAGTLDDGITELSEKSAELDAGARTLDQGAATLADGNHQLATKIHEARSGVDQLAGGIGTAADGATQLNEGVQRLDGGVQRLGNGAAQVSGGVDQLAGVLDQLSQAQNAAIAPLRQAAAQMRQVEATTGLATGPGSVGSGSSAGSAGVPVSVQLETLADQLESQGLGAGSSQLSDLHRLRDGARELSSALNDPSGEFLTGINALGAGAAQLDNGLQRLDTGATTLVDGVRQLDEGAARLDEGAATLAEGTGDLTDGTGRLVDGTSRLADGSHTLKDGTGRLSSELAAGADRVPQWDDQHREDMARTIGDPITLTSIYDNPAETFGYGFAPFFVPLALFVGGIMIWLLLTPLQSRAVATRLHPLRVVMASLQPALLLALGQAVVILLVLRFGLGMTPVHPMGALAIMALSAVAFISLIQMLNVVFGPSVGRVLSMALLMLQLTSADGIYPTAVEPAFFRWIHPFNPMTYTVQGLRQTIMGGSPSQMWIPVLVLTLVTVGAIGISTWAAHRNRVWTLERLHPPVAM
ncbi:YhgE/Pip family protein [Dietzia cinnamea]|uniref:Putative membrane protein n=1 Tax=Dietzia cinnamea TaxID=321318 RepID=A0A4R3ZSH4_9ACTN|nr:YhgE/Pip domain-containing protein [Dietzia cinnamea]PWD94799.1 hypothetical protein DEQ16_14110 [Dietzia maris]MCT1639915.1 YhgE/Pip domain-containing protein [Dietzia cinnamea]MCT2060564.1 YhgE/Pip domain-containing protein [Dietzia cinnamea]MCT2173723.1 YhgE/Pip domain-containing protein [Dietzia cinnamea]MCT2237021.1 YhgE/Pip domain-containing protein [Dietzia cinnamea]